MEGAVFALLELLSAFTLPGAASRFDGRRQLVAQKALAIGPEGQLDLRAGSFLDDVAAVRISRLRAERLYLGLNGGGKMRFVEASR